MTKYYSIIALLVLPILVHSCRINYGFTGASIGADVKTVFIDYFPNRARVVNPNLSQSFEEDLKDRFVSELGLSLRDGDGDLEFSGQITGYDTKPLSIQQGDDGRDFASQNRFTIRIKVKYVNNKDHTYDFNQEFSAFYDYDSSLSFDSVEDEAVDNCLVQIIDEIFNKSVANW